MTDGLDLVVTGGQVLTQGTLVNADIGVKNGRVAVLAQRGALNGTRRMDASGCLVLPGLINIHSHVHGVFRGDARTTDFATSSIAAAYGGFTTLVDFAHPEPGQSLLDAIGHRRAQADGAVAIDYTLHCHLPEPDERTLADLPRVVEAGITTFKVYFTRRQGARPIEADQFLRVARVLANCGGILGVHAETQALIDLFTGELLAAGKTGVEQVPRSRPPIVELDSLSRALVLAREAGCPLLFFHISAAASVERLLRARQEGQIVFAETCPHYLAFTEAEYSRPFEEAIKFIKSPPLRSQSDQDALWQGLATGTLTHLGSDEVPCQYRDKLALSLGRPFSELPGGLPQIEIILPLLYTLGVRRQRLNWPRLAACLSSTPARILGLYPQKGDILPGSDADLVVFDPRPEREVRVKELHMGTDYTPYEGMVLAGEVRATVFRGEVIVQDTQFHGRPGQGRFLVRRPPERRTLLEALMA